MKIVLIIYIVSWLILLGAYISKRFSKKEKTVFDDDKEPWYNYAAMIVLAPLFTVLMPFFSLQAYFENKKRKQLAAEREAKQKLEIEKKASIKATFQSATQSNADFAFIGKSLHQLAQDKKYGKFLQCLDKINLPKGAKLIVKECDNSANDIGDESKLLVKLPNGETDEDIFNHLIVEQSPMGAWQAYLLHTLWHVLPLFWHANYSARDYVFSKDDANSVSTFRKEDHSAIVELISKFDVAPEVRRKDNKYYVSSCYWSDFGGLVRENVELTFEGNKVTNIFEFDHKTLYKYDCGIKF